MITMKITIMMTIMTTMMTSMMTTMRMEMMITKSNRRRHSDRYEGYLKELIKPE